MYNILGSDDIDGEYCVSAIESILNIEDCHLHLYGKSESKHLKKIGHITALDESSEKADLKAKKALSSIKIDVKRSN
jgi:5-(carboxyamino)imidazole ribonucleotide synthase